MIHFAKINLLELLHINLMIEEELYLRFLNILVVEMTEEGNEPLQHAAVTLPSSHTQSGEKKSINPHIPSYAYSVPPSFFFSQ